MLRKRIGKDLRIRWHISINGERTDLKGYDLKLELIDYRGKRADLNFITEEDCVVSTFFGKDQKRLGVYRIILWVNKDKVGQTCTEVCDAFELVDCICEEKDSAAIDNLVVENAEFRSNIILGIQGLSAYESWLNQGNKGMEADFVSWIRQPAVDAQKESEELNGQLRKEESKRSVSEENRVSEEDKRVRNEAERMKAEQERKVHELLRKEEHDKLKAQSESATSNATIAAGKANEAADNANQATNEMILAGEEMIRATEKTKEATAIAEELNNHQPIIGINGNWWTWSHTADTYVDSGLPSKGDVYYPKFEIDETNMELMIEHTSTTESLVRMENGELFLEF